VRAASLMPVRGVVMPIDTLSMAHVHRIVNMMRTAQLAYNQIVRNELDALEFMSGKQWTAREVVVMQEANAVRLKMVFAPARA
jgi:hypothetical protein